MLAMAPIDPDYGDTVVDHKLPLVYLRERRRELVLAMQEQVTKPTLSQLTEIAAVQQTIKAIEAVIAE